MTLRSHDYCQRHSYLYKNEAAILRCAQPCSGINAKRNREDELLLAAVWEANPSDKPVIIVDTRPKINAVANKAKGKVDFAVPFVQPAVEISS